MTLESQFEKQKLINAVKSADNIEDLRTVTLELLDLHFHFKELVNDIFKGHHNHLKS